MPLTGACGGNIGNVMKILGVYRENTGTILGKYWECTVKILGMYRQNTANVPSKYR